MVWFFTSPSLALNTLGNLRRYTYLGAYGPPPPFPQEMVGGGTLMDLRRKEQKDEREKVHAVYDMNDMLTAYLTCPILLH